MEKKKSFRNKILPILLAAVVCIGTAAGFCTHNYLKGKTVSNVNDNGETILNYKDKAEILENIVDKNGKLVVLEIVLDAADFLIKLLFNCAFKKHRLSSLVI